MLCATVSCHEEDPEKPIPVSVPNFSRISYAGRWEFVGNPHDGRGQRNRVARSYHPGDTLTVVYEGEGFRVYGISGPKGGLGTVVLPGLPPAQIRFYSPRRHEHVLIYTSPRLPAAVHSASVVVTPLPKGKRGYVNVDDIEVYGRSRATT